MITYDVHVCIGMDNPDKHVAVKCHDTGVNIRVHPEVCKHGMYQVVQEPYIIPAGCTAVMKLAKPDKTYCITDGEIDGGTILCKMKPQAFTASGVARAEISLFGDDGRRVTSATFSIEIDRECICDCEKESENYVDAMAKQIKAAIDAEKSAKEAAERAERAAESINGGSSGYGIDKDAVHYTAEEKTDVEKSKARANIGAEAAPVELTWDQDAYPDMLSFLRTIRNVGKYTFSGEDSIFEYCLVNASLQEDVAFFHGILKRFSAVEHFTETTIYIGNSVETIVEMQYYTPATQGYVNHRVPNPTRSDKGKVLMATGVGTAEWTEVKNVMEVAV